MSRAGRLIAQITCAAATAMIVALFVPQGVGSESHSAARPAEAKSVYHFGTDAVIDSPIEGNVQVMGGQALIRSAVRGNVYVFGGNATIAEGGSVSGDVTCIAGKFAGDASRVGGHLYAAGSMTDTIEILSQTAGPTGGFSFSLLAAAVKLSLLCIWLLAAVILVFVSDREIRHSSAEVRLSPFHSFALGLVGYTSFVLTAVVFSYLIPYVIGIPLLTALAVFAILTKIYGMVAVFHSVGVLVAGARSRSELERRRWLRGDMALVLVGLVILGAVRMIPVLGSVVWMTASLLGVGVALGTKFGRREPWFLVWRPVES